MTTIEIADSFVESTAALDAADVKRAATFLDRLIHEPESASIHAERVKDAKDRSMRSMRITRDIRAIAHVDGERILLLYVAQHDDAYRWARDHCIQCHPLTGELRVVPFAAIDGAEGATA